MNSLLSKSKKIRNRVLQEYIPEYAKYIEVSDRVLSEFNSDCKSVPDINEVQWDTIESIKLSDSGSSKVIFVQTKNGSIVLKTSGEIGLDYFMNLFAHFIMVPGPKMRVIGCYEEEKIQLMKSIGNSAQNDSYLLPLLMSKLEVNFLQVMEYIPGLTLYGLNSDASQIFQCDDASGKERMIKLGIVLAFDIFLNNGDRIPLVVIQFQKQIWSNEGNVENLILAKKVQIENILDNNVEEKDDQIYFDNFYAIDHRMILLAQGQTQHQDKILENYLNEVDVYLKQLFEAMKQSQESSLEEFSNFTSIDKLQSIIYNYTQHKYCPQTGLFIARGLINGLINIVDFGITNFKQLSEILQLDEDKDECGNFNENLKRIHFEFYTQMITLITKHLLDNPDVMDSCRIYPWLQESFDMFVEQELSSK